MDSDKDFNELQTLLAEYYQGKEYNERSSVTTYDVYQRPSCGDCPSAPCDSDFDHLNQFGSPKGDDALLDNGSGEFLTRSLDKEFASTQLEKRTHHSSTIPSMHPSKTVPARDDQTGARTTAPEKDFLQQGETLPPNLSMESVDFGVSMHPHSLLMRAQNSLLMQSLMKNICKSIAWISSKRLSRQLTQNYFHRFSRHNPGTKGQSYIATTESPL